MWGTPGLRKCQLEVLQRPPPPNMVRSFPLCTPAKTYHNYIIQHSTWWWVNFMGPCKSSLVLFPPPFSYICLSWSPTLTELHCTAIQNIWSCLRWENSRLLVQQPFAPWQVCGVLDFCLQKLPHFQTWSSTIAWGLLLVLGSFLSSDQT